MAAAETNRDICYFTFGDEKLRDTIYNMYSYLKRKDVRIGTLYNILIGYQCVLKSSEDAKSKLSLYEYIKMQVECCDQDTDDETEICSSIRSDMEKQSKLDSNLKNLESQLQPVCSTEEKVTEEPSKHVGSLNFDEPSLNHNSDRAVSLSKSEKQAKLTDYFSRK